MKSLEDLAVASMVVGTEASLVGRLNTSLLGVTADQGKAAKITGIMLKCANVGYVVGRVGTQTMFTADITCLNSKTAPWELDIDVPQGATFTVGVVSSSGTAIATCTVEYIK